jgi:hypothetical protein
MNNELAAAIFIATTASIPTTKTHHFRNAFQRGGEHASIYSVRRPDSPRKQEARHSLEQANAGLGGWPKAHAAKGVAGELGVPQRTRAIDCPKDLPGPLYHRCLASLHRHGLATAGSTPECSGAKSLGTGCPAFKLNFQWNMGCRLPHGDLALIPHSAGKKPFHTLKTSKFKTK